MNTLEPPVLENPPAVDIELYLHSPDQVVTIVKKVQGRSSSDEVPEMTSPAAMALDSAGEAGTPFMEQC